MDPDGIYRYSLWRVWNDVLPRILWVMLNPSTADAEDPDRTLTRCIGFSQPLGFGSLEIVNLYAFRTKSPEILRKTIRERGETYAVGPENERHVDLGLARAATVMAAWGSPVFARERGHAMATLLRHRHDDIRCLGLNSDGSPRHPLYLPSDTAVVPF